MLILYDGCAEGASGVTAPSLDPEKGAVSRSSPAPPTHLERVEAIFHSVTDLPEMERESKVRELCGRDTQMAEEVLALLLANSRVEELISNAPHVNSDSLLIRDSGEEAAAADHETAWVGRVLGAFRLDQLIGRGGMGVVYRGERVRGGFQQLVAVKLVGQHLRSSPAIEQFLLEREILAKLEHKNIARLLDGGVTTEGFPYVVMEYIGGRRLDVACDDPTTTSEQLIIWMLQLCEAVTYVHRNLILHRDLKPGNVMITRDGVVKLLDFGTLKRIGPDAEVDSAMTRVGMRSVTVRYASPEHIRGDSVSTASDVYSLGMILYRIVAGRLPEGLEDLPIGQYLERLKNMHFKAPSEIAKRKLDPQVASDLDAIVFKAIRYEAEQRYSTTNALAEDLLSLKNQRPVAARQGNLQYVLGKFYRRHRASILTVGAVFLVLVTGLSTMAWQGYLAQVEQKRAERGVEYERQLAHMLLYDYFEKLNFIPGSTDAKRKAVTQALNYLDSLSKIASGSELELDTIRAYTDMGSLLGDPYHQNLGNVPEAIKTLNKGLSMVQTRLLREPGDLDSLSALSSIELALGGIYFGSSDSTRAEQYLTGAAKTSAMIVKDPRADPKMFQHAALVLDSLGDVYDPGKGLATADLSKAMQSYRQSDEYDKACLKLDPQNSRCQVDVVVGQYKFGLLVEDSNPALAAAHYNEGLAITAKFSPEEMKTSRGIRLKNFLGSRLGMMEMRIGQMKQGLAHVKECQDSFRESIAKDPLDNRGHFDLAAFETDLAILYDLFGRDHEASETIHEQLNNMSILLQRNPKNTRWQMIHAQGLLIDGKIESKLGHISVASGANQKGLEEAVKLAEQEDASPEMLDLAADSLMELHLRPRDSELALGFAERAIKTIPKPTAAQLLTLAKAQLASGHGQASQESAQRALAALTGPVTSKLVEDQVAEAHKLARSR